MMTLKVEFDPMDLEEMQDAANTLGQYHQMTLFLLKNANVPAPQPAAQPPAAPPAQPPVMPPAPPVAPPVAPPAAAPVSPPPVAQPPVAQPPAATPPAAPTPPQGSDPEIFALFKTLSQNGRQPEVKALLGQYGVERAGQLPPAYVEQFKQQLREMLQ